MAWGERSEAHVPDHQLGGESPVPGQGEGGDRGEEESGQVAERMGAERREHVQLFLGVMERVQAPEGGHPVVRPVGQPVGPVHQDEHQRDDDPARQVVGPGTRQPSRPPGQYRGEARAEQGHEGDYHGHVQDEEAGVLELAAGEPRPLLGRP